MNFLRPSLFNLHTDASIPNFPSVNEKMVHLVANKHFWDNLPLTFTKNFIFQIRKCTSLFSLQ